MPQRTNGNKGQGCSSTTRRRWVFF